MTNLTTRIDLPKGDFFRRYLNPNTEWRDVTFFAGAAGAGKSIELSQQVLQWHMQRPHMPIYGICSTEMEKDPAYEGLHIRQLGSDKDWSNFTTPGGLNIELFGTDGCLIIADDWDDAPKDIKLCILHFLEKVCKVGRKPKINLWWTCHSTSFYRDTSELIANTHFFYVYPKFTNPKKMALLLDDKLGLSKQAVNDVMNITDTPWIALHAGFPRMIYTPTFVALIKNRDIAMGG